MHEFENLCKGEINKNESIAPPGWCEEKQKKKNCMWIFFSKNQFLLMELLQNICSQRKKEIWVVAKVSPL
jgi:hypothetical protein